MFIIAGRVLMLLVWAVLLMNLFWPFPHPLNIFIHVALLFTALMHGLQMLLLKAAQGQNEPRLSRGQQWRIFLFGVFELLAMRHRQLQHQQLQYQKLQQSAKKHGTDIRR